MSNSNSVRSLNRSRTLLALACAVGLTLVSVPAMIAADAPAKQAVADKALPLSATFEKVASTEGTPFVLKLKNDSKDTLKLSGKVLLSVVHHAMDKARVLPEYTLEAGKVWTVTGLSAQDKVIVTATGFAPLELVVK